VRTALLPPGVNPIAVDKYIISTYNIMEIDLRKKCTMKRMWDILKVPGCIYTNDENQRGRQCTYKRNIEAHSRSHFCRGKAISNTYNKKAETKEDLAMIDSVCEVVRGYILPEARNQEQESTSPLFLFL
jgi:hypothetical protein